MSEYSRWRERRSTVATAKPPAEHAKCRQPTPSQARQGHANVSAPRTPSAPHTPSHTSTPGTRTPSTLPVPSRAAKTGGTPRTAKTGPLAARTPTHRPRTPSRRAPPPRRASHRLPGAPLHRPRRAEPPRQAACRRLHAAHAKPAKGTPNTAADNVTRVTSDTSVYVQPAQSKYDARS